MKEKVDECLIAEAALYLNRPAATLRRWDREGKVKALRHVNGYRYYKLSTLKRIKEVLEKEGHL